MILKSILIDSKAIVMKVTQNGKDDGASTPNDVLESKVSAKEEPNPSFTKAFNNLAAAFVSILELPTEYTNGLTVTGIRINRTKQGTRSAQLIATKQLESRVDYLHVMETPVVQIEKAADGESGSVMIDAKMAKAILTAIHESEKYLGGDRSQALLDFDKAKAALNATAKQGQETLAM